MGRPLSLTKEVIAELCTYIENGNTQKDAILMCGFTETTLYDWLKKARANEEAGVESIYTELSKSLKKSESRFKAYHIQQIHKASKTTWQASAWLLERKYPKEYAKVDRTSVIMEDDNGQLGELMVIMKRRDKTVNGE